MNILRFFGPCRRVFSSIGNEDIGGMKASDVLMDFIFGICFPTVDVYTDIALMYRYMFIPQCKDVGFDILDFDPTGEKRNNDPFFLLNNNFTGTIFNSCKEMGTSPKFGLLMLGPIIISTIFIFGQWLRIEDSPNERLYTFPLLLLQLYPQGAVHKGRHLFFEIFDPSLPPCHPFC